MSRGPVRGVRKMNSTQKTSCEASSLPEFVLQAVQSAVRFQFALVLVIRMFNSSNGEDGWSGNKRD